MAKTLDLYSDFRTNFEPHPVTGDLVILKNEEAVKRALRNQLLTDYYEAYWNPNRGAGLSDYLFENSTPFMQDQIKDRIRNTIENWEPRAHIESIDVELMEDENAYRATVTFSVRSKIDPVQFTVILARSR
jgi:phage baseplate assembly protein W